MQEVLNWLSSNKENITMITTLAVLACRSVDIYIEQFKRAKDESRCDNSNSKGHGLADCWKRHVGLVRSERNCTDCSSYNNNGRDIRRLRDLERIQQSQKE